MHQLGASVTHLVALGGYLAVCAGLATWHLGRIDSREDA
jgi:hypothetical protein